MQKYQHIFDTSHLHSDLKKRSLRSGAVTLSSQGMQFVIQLGSTMILARILSPSDYGINAMAVAVAGFANVFSNLGLSTATVQRAEINHEQVSTLFWINAGIGLLLTLLVAASSPLVAWFYKVPEMQNVMLALSTMFFISGFSVQHSALLSRQMRFLALAVINVSALLGGIVVAIVAAKNGFGYWSLIFNSLANVTINTVGYWLTCKWVPGLPKRNVGVSSMVKFGADLMGFNVVNYFSRNLDNILIGRFWGAGQLGLYSKAYQLLMMPITNLRGPITNVATPALSRLQNEPERYRDYYLKCVSLIAFVSMPMVVFMFFCSEQLILLLLGSQWLGASIIFKILAIAAFIQPVVGTNGMVLISTGRSRLYFIIGCINACAYVLAFFVGVSWGAVGVAVAYSVANYLLMVPSLVYTFKGTLISLAGFYKSLWHSFFSSVAMGVCLYVLNLLYEVLDKKYLLVLSFIASAIVYLCVFIFLPGGRNLLKNYFEYFNIIFKKR